MNGPSDIRWGSGSSSKGARSNPVIPRAKEDKDFAAEHEELRQRQAQEREERRRQREAEGGKCGGLNDRQDPEDRREFVDNSGFDDFGRRVKRAPAPGELPAHCQDKRDRMQAALQRSNLEEKIEERRTLCKEKLSSYQNLTEANTAEYKSYLTQDAKLSKQVERRLRQVESMQSKIQQWKLKISQNRHECEERNKQLRIEKDNIGKHFQELKAKMHTSRTEEKKRLADLTQNARNCIHSLSDQLGLAEKILKTAELCRKFETEREKVFPFYVSRDLASEFEEGNLDFGDDDLKEEIKKELTDDGIDEWTYLDTFFKRFNKVKLDNLAIEQEGSRLQRENLQLRSILKQFLDGVSVNEDVMSQPNPLLVVNGKVNLNHVPLKRIGDKKVYVEAAHHVTSAGLLS